MNGASVIIYSIRRFLSHTPQFISVQHLIWCRWYCKCKHKKMCFYYSNKYVDCLRWDRLRIQQCLHMTIIIWTETIITMIIIQQQTDWSFLLFSRIWIETQNTSTKNLKIWWMCVQMSSACLLLYLFHVYDQQSYAMQNVLNNFEMHHAHLVHVCILIYFYFF